MAGLEEFVMEKDQDRMSYMLEKCLSADPDENTVSGLAALVMHYRSRADRAEGRIEGMQLAVDYLKHRVKALEAREAGVPVGANGEPN